MGFSNTLFAGLSGLDANQTRLNVVGNNIANANTVAYKATRSLFKPQFYVTDSSGSQPTTDSGGTNPSQRGLGVAIASLEKNFNQGSIETTGKPADLALDGAGFFIVKSEKTQQTGAKQEEVKYTRDGSFKLDSADMLVTSAGDFVQGYGVDANYNLVTTSLSKLSIPLGTATTAQATTSTTFEGNLDASGTPATGSSVFLGASWTSSSGAPTGATLLSDLRDTAGNPPFTVADNLAFTGRKGGRNLTTETFTVTATSTVADLASFMQNSLGINATVAASSATVPTPGVTVESDLDPAYAHLVVAGNAGSGNQIELNPGCIKKQDGTIPMAFATGTNTAGQADNPVGESIHTGLTVYDSLGTPLRLDVTLTKGSQDSNGTTWRFYVDSSDNITATGQSPATATGTLSFGSDGKLRATTGTQIAINRFGTGAVNPLSVNMDFSQMTSFASTGSDLSMKSQDGSPVGRLSSYSIGTDGQINGVFSNGISRTLGQVVVATFINPQGLIDRGGNTYVEAANSGTAVIVKPGGEGVATLVSGALELSNVDLSEEFTNMIMASTGYSASSRVISTANQLMTELLNSSR